MSSYHEILVLRSDSGWAKLPYLDVIAADPTRRVTELLDGWMLLVVADSAPDADWLPALAQATGAPVMWCTITALESTYVRGLTKAGAWAGWLNSGDVEEELGAAMLQELDVDELFEQGGQEAIDEAMERLGAQAVDEIVTSAPVLTASLVSWAHEAGLAPDAEKVQALLEEGDSFGSRHLSNLFTLLGLTRERVL
ncbi:hypothetical protein Rhe02_72350 [Rhizocola hellebori]|uniref:Uncharacterized protein n=1 Tax=Rhizocola hellebori TaxID=1392758 RepID=A0A8J3QE15_9ACTN|nr:hypothetical protein [Rhizocola hellebori]GIH09168.1 hypothetical protein Rhe02_72350 [Rhizocola hellebori]